MFHLMKYRLKCMLQNKSLLFWTLAFPVILTTLFSLVLKEAYHQTPFDSLNVAIIDTAYYQQDTTLQQTMSSVKLDEKAMFEVTLMSEEEAKQALADKEIHAYILDGEQVQLFLKENTIETTIISSFFEEYQKQVGMIKELLSQGASPQQLTQALETTRTYTNQRQTSEDLESIYFYTALAMNCLFGGYWSINSMHEIQANQCTRAARMSCTPTKKSVYLFVDFFLCMAIELIFVLILFSYMYAILDVSFGVNTPQIMLTLLVGTVAGNATGTLLGVTSTKSAAYKTGLITSITMLCSFLSGMMMVQMKYLIQLYAPWLNMINPVNMITDALYSLYYFGIGERYYFNMISLLIFILVGYGASYIMLRKRQYQSLEAR